MRAYSARSVSRVHCWSWGVTIVGKGWDGDVGLYVRPGALLCISVKELVSKHLECCKRTGQCMMSGSTSGRTTGAPSHLGDAKASDLVAQTKASTSSSFTSVERLQRGRST